jgi:hypothetical protein
VATKRRKLGATKIGISAEAIEAWKRGSYMDLHRALGLHPWEASPLPLWCTALGCDQRTPEEDAAMEYKYRIWQDSWPRAQRLQRELLAIAGEPTQKDPDEADE